VCALKAFAAR